MDTIQKGEIAFLVASRRAVEKDFIVSRPTIPARYDLILDSGGQLYRVQVKYADKMSSNSTGSVHLDLRRKSQSKSARVRLYSVSEVDVLLVYLPTIDKILWFDSDKFDGRQSLTIRYQDTLNGQRARVLFADDYIW